MRQMTKRQILSWAAVPVIPRDAAPRSWNAQDDWPPFGARSLREPAGSIAMDVGSRRRAGKNRAWRHGLAMTLLLALVGGAGERPRGDGAAAVASAAAPRPSRASREEVARCPASRVAAGPVEPGVLASVLLAAPVCMVTVVIRGSAGSGEALLDP